jgi:hypothetical protein
VNEPEKHENLLIFRHIFFTTTQQKIKKKNLLKKNITILVQFWCAESESVFRFLPARKVPKIFLNKFSENTEKAL